MAGLIGLRGIVSSTNLRCSTSESKTTMGTMDHAQTAEASLGSIEVNACKSKSIPDCITLVC